MLQERNIADTGLNLLLEMLVMFERSEYATQFHQTYYLVLVREIFAVMTGTPGPIVPLQSWEARSGQWPSCPSCCN